MWYTSPYTTINKDRYIGDVFSLEVLLDSVNGGHSSMKPASYS